MTTRKVYEGDVLGPKKGPLNALDGFNALTQLVDAAQACISIHATENTKQEKVKAYAATELAKIRTAESLLANYFERSFAERRENFSALFERLDSALDQGNGEAVSLVLNTIVETAKTSPLANAGDLNQIRTVLDDPNHVWEL
ncbi:hypothetical protein [Rhodococcus sp. 114MFTsu3.1]|uniref:hypothetical protein n=1 Tax=Rhodococcus sp. 114MFTsu3.1 TaxID=1172184 RepID=UPI0003701407|nr:hypothetical protein [Rhodococcus sp. 114MFTsu3.1]